MRGYITRGGLGTPSQMGGITPNTAPGAPTIGTAVAGNTSATVSFTAPSSNGGSPITGYTATSTPGGIQASGPGSPINVTGLTNGTTYTFKVTATNAVGTGPASASSNGVVPTGSVTLPSAPPLAMILVQGQAQQGASAYAGNPPNDFIPQAQSTNILGWQPATPGSNPLGGYYVYRNGVLLNSVSVAEAASAYSTYVTNSNTVGNGYTAGPFAAANMVSNAFIDSAAALATGYPAGSGPSFYQGNSWSYQVSAFDNQNNEGPKSPASIGVYFANGQLITCGGTFNGTISFNATDGGTTPSGYTKTAKWTSAGGGDLINVFADCGCPSWNLNIRAYSFLNFAMKPSASGTQIQMLALRVGDININSGPGQGNLRQLSAYGTLVTNQYTVFKIPLADLMTDYQLGQQLSWYKLDVQNNGSAANIWIDNWYFSTN